MNFRTPKITVALPCHSGIILGAADPFPQPPFQRSDPNSTPSDRHLADKHIRNLPNQAMCPALEPSKPIRLGPSNRLHHSFPIEPYPPATSAIVSAAPCSDAPNPTVPDLCLSDILPPASAYMYHQSHRSPYMYRESCEPNSHPSSTAATTTRHPLNGLQYRESLSDTHIHVPANTLSFLGSPLHRSNAGPFFAPPPFLTLPPAVEFPKKSINKI
jgi:hypothetical protein